MKDNRNMFYQNFCEVLARRINEVFSRSANEEIRGLRCDDILWSSSDGSFALQAVRHKRKVVLKAFINGHEPSDYQLVLKFGDKALNSYTHNLDMGLCIPNTPVTDWFTANVRQRKIEIQMD